ncbi:MAG: ECF transporter S component [Clostridiales bacterium]|nr:ECF transporter S component [Clostridiales bacterium]
MENTKSVNNNVLRLTQISVLTAIMLIMAFTPLGYLRIATVEITFMMIPVVIGAIILGPKVGALLGGVFGITSFIQCFGASSFGAALLSINPFYTFILCMVPRIVMGWLSGIIFEKLYKHDQTKILSFGVSTLSGAILNTVLFVVFLMVMFGRSEFIVNLRGGKNIIPFIIAFVGINGLVEAIVCFIIGAALSKALYIILPNTNNNHIE